MRRILALNVLVLLVPILGLLHLDQYRQSLIASEIEALTTQARTFSLALGSTAVRADPEAAEETLVSERAGRLMRVLLTGTDLRARLFALNGKMITDSFTLGGPSGVIEVIELPTPSTGVFSWLDRFYDRLVNWLPGGGDLPRYVEDKQQQARDYREVRAALKGETKGLARVDEEGRLVLSVAVPVQRYRKVLGALMLSKGGADVEAAVKDRRRDVLIVFAVALGVTVLLSIYLASTIARPIRALAAATEKLRHGAGRDQGIPDFSKRNDEIGDLSKSLKDMTEALRARLDAIEGFAADVTHEIKNPLTSLRSAVETVARVEDPAQRKRLIAIIQDDVQRLDRLLSDIGDASRLDAELSRASMEEVDVAELLEAIVEVHQAAAAERGVRFRSELSPGSGLRVAGLEGRLGQVFRNLISNALSFSPPEGEITLAAGREGGHVWIAVSDQGPGLPEEKLEEVFSRFYSERPREEKYGTHSGLGLSISKQIVEAHGGTIRAVNRYDASGRTAGARFVVKLPAP